jgi:dTDP-4-dehydrorhamnose reductase
MKILITGANGQLGNEMRRIAATLSANDEWLFTDVEELDICDPDAIERMIRDNAVEAVVNCAAYTNVNGAETNVELCTQLNSVAPGNLAAAAHRHHCRFIHISTDYVFDGKQYRPYREDDAPCPDSVYGRTKLEGEHNVMVHCPEAVIVRTAWLYSTHGNNFVKTMIRLGREKESLTVVFDQIGTPTHARDLALAVNVILHSLSWNPGIYHYSDEGVCSWYDFAMAIFRVANIMNCKVIPIHTSEYPTPARRPHYSVLDKTKIKETYGVAVPYWMDSLVDCIDELEELK